MRITKQQRMRYDLANRLLELADSHTLTRDQTLLAQTYAFQLRLEKLDYRRVSKWYEEVKR